MLFELFVLVKWNGSVGLSFYVLMHMQWIDRPPPLGTVWILEHMCHLNYAYITSNIYRICLWQPGTRDVVRRQLWNGWHFDRLATSTTSTWWLQLPRQGTLYPLDATLLPHIKLSSPSGVSYRSSYLIVKSCSGIRVPMDPEDKKTVDRSRLIIQPRQVFNPSIRQFESFQLPPPWTFHTQELPYELSLEAFYF